ncbi:MAG TPA: hypothetical protein VM716_10795 [Gemmatimonadales bacterium]|nr:hypothetical protein [Gemmatimonadales bacterium]
MKRKLKGKPRRLPRAKAPAPAPAAVVEADPFADTGVRPLLERYCKLARVKQAALGPDHADLALPEAERPFFRGRERVHVAFSLDALERDPDAEIAVLGSPFLSQLIEAIRARAARLSLGLIAPDSGGRGDAETGVELPLAVRDGVAKAGKTRVASHPVGRLVARVVLRAGAGVEEVVLESDVYDLSAGAKVDADLAATFGELEAGRLEPADASLAEGVAAVPAREPADLLRLLLSHLQEKAAERVAARRGVAERQLAVELGRLDRYFESMLKDQADAEAIAAVTALAERRRTEEIRRSQVKAVVHPLQLIEASALIERAEWRLESTQGRRATFSAQRSFGSTGAGGWIMACPHCGRPPATLVVCRHEAGQGGHCACEACSYRCSVCAEGFCTDHGIAQCRVDGQPACDEHMRACPSCRLEYCTAHEGSCVEGSHTACTACLAPCGSCGRAVCNRHAQESSADAPKGKRRLCNACLRYCEGGTNEPVGIDEVTECASCGKPVCTVHQAVCVVDGRAHCSPHLRRSGQSQRLVCARHMAECAHEPAAVFAADEVEECPICGKDACARHQAVCGYCGRRVCTTDFGPPEPAGKLRRCATCAQLAAVKDPPEAVVAAVLKATGGARRTSRRWRMARDRSHLVLELDLGLTRKTVVTVRHGSSVPESVVRHSLLRSKWRRYRSAP